MNPKFVIIIFKFNRDQVSRSLHHRASAEPKWCVTKLDFLDQISSSYPCTCSNTPTQTQPCVFYILQSYSWSQLCSGLWVMKATPKKMYKCSKNRFKNKGLLILISLFSWSHWFYLSCWASLFLCSRSTQTTMQRYFGVLEIINWEEN